MFSSTTSSSRSAGNESAEEDVADNHETTRIYESAEDDVAAEEDESAAEDDVFYIAPKNPTTQSLQRWKKIRLVLNAVHRFRFTDNVGGEQKQRLRRLRSRTHDVRAVNLFLKATAAVHVLDDSEVKPEKLSLEAGAAVHVFDGFEVKPEELVHMVQEHQFQVLEELGGVEGVVSLLRTSLNLGLKDDLEELEARRKAFGSITYPRQPDHKQQFWDFFSAAAKDLTWVILIVCAVSGLASHRKTRWCDGISMAIAGILAILVTSIVDYRQYIRFSALHEEKTDKQNIEVVRGGRRKEISIFQIVVGDIVVLNSGDQVPADGLLVFDDGYSLYIDQSSLTGESEPIHVHHEMPFLVAGGKVEDGHGVMVVTSTGGVLTMAATGEKTVEFVANLTGKVGMTVEFVGHTEGPTTNSGQGADLNK